MLFPVFLTDGSYRVAGLTPPSGCSHWQPAGRNSLFFGRSPHDLTATEALSDSRKGT